MNWRAIKISRTGSVRLALAVTCGLGAVLAGSPSCAQTMEQARAFHRAGKLDEALAAYHAVAEQSEASDPATAASARNNACVLLTDRGDHRLAVEDCLQALELRRGVDDPRRLARTLNNLGLSMQYLGRLEEAQKHFAEALSINEARSDPAAQVINLANLGVLATQAGRYSRAIDRHAQALALAEQHPDEAWSAGQVQVARINQAVVLERLGAFREALALYERVLADGNEKDPWLQASLLVNRGVVYRNLGDPLSAIAAFERAAETYRELGARAALSNVFLNLGLARHLNLERPLVAERDYREALRLAQESGDRSEEIQDLYYLGRLLLESGRF